MWCYSYNKCSNALRKNYSTILWTFNIPPSSSMQNLWRDVFCQKNVHLYDYNLPYSFHLLIISLSLSLSVARYMHGIVLKMSFLLSYPALEQLIKLGEEKKRGGRNREEGQPHPPFLTLHFLPSFLFSSPHLDENDERWQHQNNNFTAALSFYFPLLLIFSSLNDYIGNLGRMKLAC